MIQDKQICTRCIYDSDVPNIQFDADGVCNYCLQVEELKELYGTGTEVGQRSLDEIVSEIKKAGRGRQYDCIVGVSGGTDSSFLLMKAVDWGLRPLAVHYDNTWNSAIATENIRKITAKLGVDLYTYVIDNRESEDIYRAFLEAGVQEFDASTDIAFVQTLRASAAKHKVKYILEGHSFVAEGVSPLGTTYIDGAYIADVHKRYGKKRLKTYPNMKFWTFLKWVVLYRQKFIRPLWYMEYSKEQAQSELQERLGWTYYGGHHLENRAPAFAHTVLRPQRFKQDLRNLALSARARAGLLSHEEALAEYAKPVVPDPQLVEYVCKRLGLSEADFDRVMSCPKQSFRDFRNYKKRFERLRPLFFILAKMQLVPMSFYKKYCFPLPKR